MLIYSVNTQCIRCSYTEQYMYILLTQCTTVAGFGLVHTLSSSTSIVCIYHGIEHFEKGKTSN